MIIKIDATRAAEIARQQFKAQRQAQVDSITVEVDGMVFQGDETSQARMARAIVALAEGEMLLWVLANNTPVQVTKAQLTEALRLAGQSQAAIWVQS